MVVLLLYKDMTLQFEDETLSPATYSDEDHPLVLFLKADAEGREDILLSHPDVIGFVYIQENSISKAFLPKKIINFKATAPENKKIIAAVTGDTEDFTPFSIAVEEILNNCPFMTDCSSLNENTPAISIAKYVKDNLKDLPKLPNQFSSDAKTKKLRAAACPYILPLIRGISLPEGDIDDKNLYKLFSEKHDIYADWIFLRSGQTIITTDFSVNGLSCPMPQDALNKLSASPELLIKILFKNKKDSSSPFCIIKSQVETFLLTHKKEVTNASVPIQEVNIAANDNKTVATCSTNSTPSNAASNCLVTFFSILFAKNSSNEETKNHYLEPTVLTDEVQEIMTNSSSTSEQARMIGEGIQLLAEDVTKEKIILVEPATSPF